MTDAARAVENLIYQYAELIDRGDLPGVGRLFANGRIEAAPGVSYEGAEAVQRLYEATTRLHGSQKKGRELVCFSELGHVCL